MRVLGACLLPFGQIITFLFLHWYMAVILNHDWNETCVLNDIFLL